MEKVGLKNRVLLRKKRPRKKTCNQSSPRGIPKKKKLEGKNRGGEIEILQRARRSPRREEGICARECWGKRKWSSLKKGKGGRRDYRRVDGEKSLEGEEEGGLVLERPPKKASLPRLNTLKKEG